MIVCMRYGCPILLAAKCWPTARGKVLTVSLFVYSAFNISAESIRTSSIDSHPQRHAQQQYEQRQQHHAIGIVYLATTTTRNGAVSGLALNMVPDSTVPPVRIGCGFGRRCVVPILRCLMRSIVDLGAS